MVLLLVTSLAIAQERDWKVYGIGAGCTALSIPVTYLGASLLTSTSNRLVLGLLPPVLWGVMVPSSTAYFSTKFAAGKAGVELSKPGLAYGATIGSNVGLYAGGTALKVSSDQIGEVVAYGLISAAVLPLPTWLMIKNPNASAALSVVPSNDGARWQGGYRVSFWSIAASSSR
jgi:hypothetical protein